MKNIKAEISGNLNVARIIKNKSLCGYIKSSKDFCILEGEKTDIYDLVKILQKKTFLKKKPNIVIKELPYEGKIKDLYVADNFEDVKLKVYVFISGIIQNVSYDTSTKRFADELGVTGWIKNNDDGTIDAKMEGGYNKVEELTKWMKLGTSKTIIHDFRVEYLKYQNEFKKFNVIK